MDYRPSYQLRASAVPRNIQASSGGLMLGLNVCYRRQKWRKLVEDLTREHDASRGYGQAGNAQRLGRPCIAGVTKIIRSSGRVENALRIGTSTDAAGTPILVCGQI